MALGEVCFPRVCGDNKREGIFVSCGSRNIKKYNIRVYEFVKNDTTISFMISYDIFVYFVFYRVRIL